MAGLCGLTSWRDAFGQGCTPSFVPGPSGTIGSNANGIAVADWDRDGLPDVLVANSGDSTVTVLVGTLSGGLLPLGTVGVPGSPTGVCAIDVNGDGWLDLVTANLNGGSVGVLVRIPGQMGVGVATPTAVPVSASPFTLAAGDLNGDGIKDLVVGHLGSSIVTTLLGNAGGGFDTARTFSAGLSPTSLALGDVNGDGRLDVATANLGATTFSVLLGAGDGGLLPALNLPGATGPRWVGMSDMNGDGKQDLITVSAGAGLSVLLGTGTGGFLNASSIALPTGSQPATIADVNNDGRPDVLVPSTTAAGVSVVTNNGNGTLQNAGSIPCGASPQVSAAIDVDHDGRPDVAVVRLTGVVSTLRNTTPQITIQSQPGAARVAIGSAATVSVGATGGSNLNYQWRFNGVALPSWRDASGAKSPTLVLSAAQAADDGVYDVIVSNECGGVLSRPTYVSVNVCVGDITHDGIVSPEDIFAFLSAYFAGCP